MLGTQPDRLLYQFPRLPYRLVRMVLPFLRGSGVHQHLYQSFHLRRQVPRVPARRQASHL